LKTKQKDLRLRIAKQGCYSLQPPRDVESQGRPLTVVVTFLVVTQAFLRDETEE